MQLSVADRNAVDTVCAAMPCAVLDVSGRPLDITGIVPEADAIVASWLPGSEGEGVADVLFGHRPFTGSLPETWAKAESQLPINVGDATYDPLYPFGWGLRTDSAEQRIQTLRGQLNAVHGTSATVKVLDKLLNKRNWNPDGSPRNVKTVLKQLDAAAKDMTGAPYTFAEQDLLVSVARDIAQDAIVAGGASAMSATASMTADADHDLLSGQPEPAVELLTQARSTAAGLATSDHTMSAPR